MGLSHKKAIRFKYVFPAFISAPSQPDVAADIENRAVANIVAQCTAAAQSCAWPCRLAQLEPLKSPTEKKACPYGWHKSVALMLMLALLLLRDMKEHGFKMLIIIIWIPQGVASEMKAQ